MKLDSSAPIYISMILNIFELQIISIFHIYVIKSLMERNLSHLLQPTQKKMNNTEVVQLLKNGISILNVEIHWYS